MERLRSGWDSKLEKSMAAEEDRASKSSASIRQFTSNKALVGDSRSGVGGNQVQSTRWNRKRGLVYWHFRIVRAVNSDRDLD